MARVLVTGGAGYVGSHTVRALVENAHRVVVLDDLSTGHRAALPVGVPLVLGSVLEPMDIARAFQAGPFDAICHFAAHALVGASMAAPWRYLGDNVRGATFLIEAAVAHGVGRFVFSSTANLFDAAEPALIVESQRVAPCSPYGESKHIVERLLHWAERLHGMRFAALRYFNAAGAHPDGTLGECHHPETHLVPLVFDVAASRRSEVVIFGDDYPTPDGTCVRDFVHVVDLAAAHVLALDALADRSLTLHLGSGQGTSVRELVRAASEVAGVPIPTRIGPRRPGDPPRLVAAIGAAADQLGWRPSHSDLGTVLASAWAWHRRQPSAYGCRR